MGMTDLTPYHERPPSEIAREVACMDFVLTQARPVPLVFEAFGGTGETAQVLRSRVKPDGIRAFDLDAMCVATYNARHGGRAFRATKGDALAGFRSLSRWRHEREHWGASLDYNKFTLLSLTHPSGPQSWKRELLREVLAQNPTWIELTDSAIRYLHLNFKSYGLRSPTLSSYLARVAEAVNQITASSYTYHIAAAAHHSAASYLLLQRGRAAPTWSLRGF